jgi:hypothetical protein
VAMSNRMVSDAVRNTADVHDLMHSLRDAVGRRNRMPMRRPDPHVVAGRIVTVLSPAVATGKSEERHGGHPGGSENHSEDVEIHLYVR